MIKDEKIGNYPLGQEDYENEDIRQRLDVSYMHKKIYGKEIEKELLSQIIEENKQKYRSLIAEKEYTYDEQKKIKDEKNAIQDENNKMIDFLKQLGLMEEYEKSKKDKKG